MSASYINMFTAEVNEKLYEFEHNPSGEWSWKKDKYVTREEMKFCEKIIEKQLADIKSTINSGNSSNSINTRWDMTRDLFKFFATNVAKRILKSYPKLKVALYQKLLEYYYSLYKVITIAPESTLRRQISGHCIDIFGFPIGHRNGDVSVDKFRNRTAVDIA
jgi:hypothetical protein